MYQYKSKAKIGVLLLTLMASFFLTIGKMTQAQDEAITPGSVAQDFHGFEMIYVPGGRFEMGIEKDAVHDLCVELGESDPERCVEIIEEDTGSTYTYSVELQPFWIDRYEFTIEKYEQFCGEITYIDTCVDLSRTPQLAENPQQPQVGVTWYAAEFMCNIRGARLPSEEEWEYAASGPEKLIFPWGNSFVDEYTHLPDTSSAPGETYPVGSIPENVSWSGVYDLAGNAAEWVEDYYLPRILANNSPENWSQSTDVNYVEIARVVRGGSWDGRIWPMATFYREFSIPHAGDTHFGFRCARSLAPVGQ